MKRRTAAAARGPAANGPAQPLQDGLVIASHGRHCVVETPGGERVICHPRGKKSQVVAGDRVRWQPSRDEGTIEQVAPRRNLLYRQDALRTKSFAANLDQVLILLGAEPVFSEHQLARALIACEAARIAPLIVLNKADLAAPFARAWQRLAPYRAMGCTVLALAAEPRAPVDPVATAPGAGPAEGDEAARAAASALTPEALRPWLAGRTTLVLGPSGAGKSTLINRLIPQARAATGEISQALGSGRHTTTATTWYWLDDARSGALIDSPGFQEFGLHHIDPMQLAACMPDLRPHVAGCRFYNCTHLHEPGCGVRAAVQGEGEGEGETAGAASAPAISASRYRIYGELFAELRQAARMP